MTLSKQDKRPADRSYHSCVFRGLGTSIHTTPAAEAGVLHAEFIDRVVEFGCRYPSEVTRASYPMTAAVFSEAVELANLASVLSKDASLIPPAGLEDGFDFSFPEYSAFEDEVEEVLKELEALPDDLFLPFAPSGPFLSRGEEPITTRAGEEASTFEAIREWVAKIFAALGVKEAYQAMLEALESQAPRLMEELGRNIATKQWRAVTNILKSLFRIFTSGPFLRKLAEKIGVRAASKLIGQIAAKFVPFLGWALIVASLVWAVAEEFI